MDKSKWLRTMEIYDEYEKRFAESRTNKEFHVPASESDKAKIIEKVKKMIRRQEERYGWEFLFVAANIDAVETARNIGIRRDRAANYNHTGKGTRDLYEAMDCAVTSMRNCEAPNEEWKKKLK